MDFNFTLPPDFGPETPKKDLALPDGFTGLVLHACCAPCSTAVLECLIYNGIKPTVFFYNPNIHPGDEYIKRRDEWLHLCALLNLDAVVGDYDTKEWFCAVKGHEQDKERGARCSLCFEKRLTVTAQFAKSLNISHFTTTLATSRWKSKRQVDDAGYAAQSAVGGVSYWDFDWRKEGLVTRRYALVKEIGFYNQQYCGCVYSMAEAGYVKNPQGSRN